MIEGVALPIARGGHAAGIVEGFAVTAGGTNWSEDRTKKAWLDDCLVYRDGKWASGPRLPRPIAYAMFAHDKSGLYVAGGSDETRKFAEVYHLRYVDGREGWRPLPPLPMAISAGAAAAIDGVLYVTCGEVEGGMTNRMWSLSLVRPQAGWKELEPLPGPARGYPAVTCIGTEMYILGGISNFEPMTVLKDAYRYDTKAARWEKMPDLPRAGYAWTAAPVGAQSLLMAGRADGEIHREILLFDLESHQMTQIGQSVTPTTTAPLIQVRDSEWWLIGGEPDSNKTRTNRITIIRRQAAAVAESEEAAATP
jgi:N-acetylneuraminic acid mutarotase